MGGRIPLFKKWQKTRKHFFRCNFEEIEYSRIFKDIYFENRIFLCF